MEYRRLHSGTRISALGLGSGFLRDAGEDAHDIVSKAMDAGVNFMETSMYDDSCAPAIRQAVREHGDGMVFQLQTGVHYPGGQYEATRDPQACRDAFETELGKYGLDHADLLLFHCVDEPADYDDIMSRGLYDMLVEWRDEGRVDNIGFSTHSVEICRRFMEDTVVDDFMLSLNPTYDFVAGDGGLVMDSGRLELYRECERRGIGIVVMKPYGGGILMDAETSPFGRAMTPAQCIQYALDRPGAVTVVPGVASMEQLDAMLSYLDASKEERDYSFIGGMTAADMSDQCVYCNHCLPCPAGIDIGRVNKFSDLYAVGDMMAGEHYRALQKHASDCLHCGRCTKRCPFHIDAEGHVALAAERFGI